MLALEACFPSGPVLLHWQLDWQLPSFLSPKSHSDSKVTLYECEDFQGRKFEMCDDYPSLQAMGWCSKEVPSIKVNSGA